MADNVFGLYPGAPKQQDNLLAGDPSKVIGVLNALNQNVLQQQEIGSRRSLEDLYKNALKPDGTIDGGVIAKRLSEGAGGYRSPEIATAAQAQEGQRLQQAEASRGIFDNVIGSLRPNASNDEIVHQLTVASRHMPGVASAMFNGTIRELKTATPEQRLEIINNAKRRSLGAAALAGGSPDLGVTPQGVARKGQVGQFIEETDMGTGGVPKPAPVPGAPSPAAQITGTGANTLPGSLPIGAEKSSAILQADLEKASTYGQEIYPWMQALDKVKALGAGGTAPGSKGRQEVESFLYGLSPEFAKVIPGFDATKIKNYAELEKYLTQATQQRAQGFGVHTDQGLATAIAGSPNVHINDLAVHDVVKSAIALRRMEHAQTIVNEGAGPVGYTSSKSKWATGQDPVAYAVDLMTPEARTKYIKSLKGKSLQRFNDSLQSAYASGVIDRPGQ